MMLTVVGIGIAATMHYFVVTSEQLAHYQMTVTATLLAKEQVNRISLDKVSRGYSYITNAAYPASEILAPTFSQYTRQVNVYEVSATDLTNPAPGSGYKRVDVVVLWGPQAHERIQISSLYTLFE